NGVQYFFKRDAQHAKNMILNNNIDLTEYDDAEFMGDHRFYDIKNKIHTLTTSPLIDILFFSSNSIFEKKRRCREVLSMLFDREDYIIKTKKHLSAEEQITLFGDDKKENRP